MYAGDANKPFRLGNWLVEPDLNRLSDGDRVIALEPRLMDLLTYLASQPGKTVGADDLLETVWHGRVNVDNTIYQAIAHLRKMLGDDVHQPRYIKTIAKKGYRLISPVTSVAENTEVPEIAIPSPSGWQPRRRNLAIFAGIASIAVAIILTVNPELRDQLLPTNEGPTERSVAVLPFIDMSEDGSQQYLADGVAEELIHVLSNLPDLRVTARTSSFAFRDSNKDIRQIGSKLNVATILEGSIRKDGDRIRVTAQLVNTHNGYHLWSQTYNRDTADVLGIQSEIAAAVSRSFELRELRASANDDRVARAVDLQAYDFYLLGMHYLRKDTVSSYPLAVEYFERAIEADPSFARAYAGLSEGYANRYWDEGDQGLLDKAEYAADHAVLLDDRSADAFVALGHIKVLYNDQPGAIAAFEKAIELNPNDAEAYAWLASRHDALGREDLAFSMVQKALELDPMSAEMNNTVGLYQYQTSLDWDSAYPYFKRAMEVDPEYPSGYGAVGLYYMSTGQLDQAIPYFRKVADLHTGQTKVGPGVDFLIMVYVDIGDFASAAETIDRMREYEPDNFTVINTDIQLQLARGEFSAARNIVHSMLPTLTDDDWAMELMAFYEMVLGDISHAEDIYSRVTAVTKPADVYGNQNLFWGSNLMRGMLGAVNLAHLHMQNGAYASAQELLHKAQAYTELRSNALWYGGGIQYVRAQISAIEGNNDAAIEYVRKAVDAGWSKAWFGRIDPIMADLRKDARYLHILEELEDKLLELREHPQVLALN